MKNIVLVLYYFRLVELSEQKKENTDDTGFIYDMHEKIREILTEYNDTVEGRCAVCLERFCEDDSRLK